MLYKFQEFYKETLHCSYKLHNVWFKYQENTLDYNFVGD